MLGKKHKKNIKKYFKKRFENKNSTILVIVLFFVLFFSLVFLLLIVLLYSKLLFPLPDVRDLKNIKIPETSIIYDKNGWELYKIYSENRTYVEYDFINKNMINAIVSSEDKRFWTNPWYDTIWIIRAIKKWLANWNNFKWTSTITQQLAKITYLSNERSLERKFKELYLSIKLNNYFDKKDILEVYLNKVFFWWNSYWIEQASKTFFWLNASELWVLEASIMASLPKAPTSLSPYIHKKELLWYPVVYYKLEEIEKNIKDIKSRDKKNILSKKGLEENKKAIDILSWFVNGLRFYHLWDNVKICQINDDRISSSSIFIDSNKCVNIPFNQLITFLNSIHIEKEGIIIEYKTGRKDYVLWRMFEDKYITAKEYKDAIISSFWFEFNKYKDKIRYPYFVMYIKDYLVKKYWENILNIWGYRIYTSIDPNIQDKAQEILEKQVEINKKNIWAKNASLITLDNKTWEIVSFIWWKDYFDSENWWNNNMLLARLQPWSSFKPFVYILSMMNKKYWSWTYINDNKITFPWWYSPHNSDWKFMWRMTLSQALNHSRNIPAIKLYYAAWKEEWIIKFLDKFWMKSLLEFKEEYKKKYWYEYNYSAPMALGTAQITPIELAQAYSVFANNWIKNELKPILKIIDHKWKILEDFTKINNSKNILDSKWSYTLNSMLSNVNDRPRWRNRFLTIPNRKLAAKTWTSTKQYLSNKWTKDSKWKWYKKTIIAPRNLWVVGYTPQYTTVVWVGNTSWKELYWKAYWLTWAWPIMQKVMSFIHKWLEVENWVK